MFFIHIFWYIVYMRFFNYNTCILCRWVASLKTNKENENWYKFKEKVNLKASFDFNLRLCFLQIIFVIGGLYIKSEPGRYM